MSKLCPKKNLWTPHTDLSNDDCPDHLFDSTMEVQYRDGTIVSGYPAQAWTWAESGRSTIVAYRVIK